MNELKIKGRRIYQGNEYSDIVFTDGTIISFDHEDVENGLYYFTIMVDRRTLTLDELRIFTYRLVALQVLVEMFPNGVFEMDSEFSEISYLYYISEEQAKRLLKEIPLIGNHGEVLV